MFDLALGGFAAPSSAVRNTKLAILKRWIWPKASEDLSLKLEQQRASHV